MRGLIACEESGIVREAFNAVSGFSCVSCDILPPADGRVDYHHQGDVREILSDGWDFMIAFPPCTYLCSSGMHWTTRGLRDPQLTEDALDFVVELLNAPIPHKALENPTGCIGTRIRPSSQAIQPYQFGDDASKETRLWLVGLPLLLPTKYIPPRIVNGKKRWANQTDSGQNRLGPSEKRAALRGYTYPGIAAAMADQWSRYYHYEIYHRTRFKLEQLGMVSARRRTQGRYHGIGGFTRSGAFGFSFLVFRNPP